MGSENKRVVITGMGIVSSNGSNVPNFDQSLRQGKSGIKHVEELKDLGFKCQIGGIATFDEPKEDYYLNHFVDRTNHHIQLACVAGVEAYVNSGFELKPKEEQVVDWDTGILIGTVFGGSDYLAKHVVPLVVNKGTTRVRSRTVLNSMAGGAAAKLAEIVSVGNKVSTNSSGCCTGSEAILESYYHIQSGRAKRMITGGAEGYSPYYWAGFDSLRVICSWSNEFPERGSSPMANTGFGFVPSSGAGILMLEDLDSALERGAKIYGEILGGASNCGGQHNGGTFTFPNREGMVRCIKSAMENTNVKATEVDLINAHLTGTKADALEVSVWKEVLDNNDNYFPYIQSTKSMIGHGIGAAGSLECVAAILQLHHQYIHPSINSEPTYTEILDLIGSDRIPKKILENQTINIIAKSSFAFGDVNCCLLFKRWTT